MPEVIFVLSPRQHDPLQELADTLRYELELQGVPGRVHRGWFPAGNPRTVYVLIDPASYLLMEGHQALPDDAILRRTIFVWAGRPPASTADQDVALLRRAGAVFVLDQRSVVAMHRLGIPARLLKPGYSKSLDRFDPSASRSIDVMFLGSHSPRRSMYLNRAASVLARRNCLLAMSEPGPSAAGSSSVLGSHRGPLLAQTKVLMNLHRGEDSRFEWQRALDAIHAGAVVVSEHSSGIAPLTPGEHLLVASPDSLPYVVDALLRDPERLAALREQAYERVSTWIPYALWVSVLRAAIVELVGEPLPSDAPLPSQPGTSAVGDAGADDSQPQDPAAGGREAAEDGGSAGTGAVPAGRARGRVSSSTPRRTKIRSTTPAWEVGRTPRLTVLTTLTGAAQEAVDTIDSLVRNRMCDLELVVVDAGAGEPALAAITDWMVAHPRIAVCLLDPDVDRGVGAARNIGLDFARGSACLILDPGQALYPRCLDVLAATLEGIPTATFVYPIQQVTGETEAFVAAGGDYLLSFLGWDPRRLHRGNYIHAPVLIRTRTLRELGGFATDERQAGREEYDMWCRIADCGWGGQLVPQILARRAESGSSSALMTGALPGRAQPWRRRMKSPRSVR